MSGQYSSTVWHTGRRAPDQFGIDLSFSLASGCPRCWLEREGGDPGGRDHACTFEVPVLRLAEHAGGLSLLQASS